MSRSNPSAHARNMNPCTRWFEWNGETGEVRYYDKEKKENIPCGSKVAFLVLERLYTIKGFDEKNKCGIVSNEIRDTRGEILVVKSFEAGTIAEGIYSQIKEKVNYRGGSFAINLYVGFKQNGELKLGSFMCRGAALGSWIDFEKEHGEAVWERGVMIDGSTHEKKGKIEFEIPIFKLIEVSAETDAEAKTLDETLLQPYLKTYFAQPKGKQADQTDQSSSYDESDANQEQGGGQGEPDSRDYRDAAPRGGGGSRPSQQSAPPQKKRPAADPDLDAPEDDIPF